MSARWYSRLWNWLNESSVKNEPRSINIDPVFIDKMVENRTKLDDYSRLDSHNKKIADVANRNLPKKLKEESCNRNEQPPTNSSPTDLGAAYYYCLLSDSPQQSSNVDSGHNHSGHDTGHSTHSCGSSHSCGSTSSCGSSSCGSSSSCGGGD